MNIHQSRILIAIIFKSPMTCSSNLNRKRSSIDLINLLPWVLHDPMCDFIHGFLCHHCLCLYTLVCLLQTLTQVLYFRVYWGNLWAKALTLKVFPLFLSCIGVVTLVAGFPLGGQADTCTPLYLCTKFLLFTCIMTTKCLCLVFICTAFSKA